MLIYWRGNSNALCVSNEWHQAMTRNHERQEQEVLPSSGGEDKAPAEAGRPPMAGHPPVPGT
jgi:hypothetical protein